jgi:dienelactone hydrolase
LVLLHGCRGLHTSLGYRRWVDRFLSWGYVVLAVDSLTPRDARSCFEMDKVNAALVGTDAYAALKFLRSQSFVAARRTAVVGYSFGANGVLRATQTDGSGRTERLLAKAYPALAPFAFRAAIAFYPVESSALMRFSTPMLILVGDRDDSHQVQALRDLGEHQRQFGDPTTVHIYPGATHAFDMEPDDGAINAPFIYDAAATADAAERVKAFLAANLK